MKNIHVGDSVAQKMAGVALTTALREKFNLHPHSAAKDLFEHAKKVGVTPDEAMKFLEEHLPKMTDEFLADTKAIMEKMAQKAAEKN